MKVINKKAQFDYELSDRVEAGVVLTGAEAKAARAGHVKLDGAHIKIDAKTEAYVVNMHIFPYKFASDEGYEPDRSRKLLIHMEELTILLSKMKQGRMTLVPTALYTRGPRVKLEIALARGERKYEKREKVQKRDEARDTEREWRNKR